MSVLRISYNAYHKPWVIDAAAGAALAGLLLKGRTRALVMASDVVAAGVSGPPGSILAVMLDELRGEEDSTMVVVEWR